MGTAINTIKAGCVLVWHPFCPVNLGQWQRQRHCFAACRSSKPRNVNSDLTARLRRNRGLTTNEHQLTLIRMVKISAYLCPLVVGNLRLGVDRLKKSSQSATNFAYSSTAGF
jgi:hypothetical protein